MLSFFRRKRTVLLSTFLLVHLFLMSALPASAGFFGGGPSIPSPSQFFGDAERRYHIDPQALQSQGESFNTAGNKQPTPAVSLFFNPSDPREGEKISAKAFPMYFSDNEKNLYYTWYLKHAQCDLKSNPNPTEEALCDRDGDGKITLTDWKMEATRIIVENGYDPAQADPVENYASDDDDDGYKARFGGDNKVGVVNHCYVSDAGTGNKYELGDSGNVSFDCGGQTPVCLIEERNIDPGVINLDATGGSVYCDVNGCTGGGGSASASGTPFGYSDSGLCHVSGYPICTGAGTPTCSTGYPRCVADIQDNPLGCGVALNSCSGGGAFNPFCKHLFADAPGFTTGDGNFGRNEERFWSTNPHDPDTADNGNKDEANVTGLGQEDFEWNYATGDQVGVAVEGTSMISTKYNDSSSMVMWAFSKGDCPISLADSTGSFYRNIRGYQVTMLSADMDINKCLERNLVDPTQGGQATSLDVSVTSTPDSPINDETTDAGGDTVVAEASVDNAAKGTTEILFDWSVELSNNPQFVNSGTLISAVVTSDLQGLKLLGNVKGTALDTTSLKLNILNNPTTLLAGRPLASYLTSNIGYLRFTAKATENFSSGTTRKGKSDVIVKFTSTGKKITAYKVDPVSLPSGMQVKLNMGLPSTGIICNDDSLDRVACRVIKNEIIGLRVDPTNLSNFQWTINGAPLTCSRAVVSQDCEKDAANNITIGQQNFVNFFPVSGNVGDTYTVTLNANDVKTGKAMTLARTFHVIEPALSIVSNNLTTAWPKLTGQYRDVDGVASIACPGGMCNQYSDSVYEGFATENIGFKAVFIPDFLKDTSKRQWTVDDISMDESGPMTISFTALKAAPDVYNIALSASVVQSQEIRRALRDIWNISPLESTEINFSMKGQVKLKEPGFAQGTLPGTKKYLAALASYIPASVMFSFRIVLSVVLLLFTARFFLTILPEHLNTTRSYGRKYE